MKKILKIGLTLLLLMIILAGCATSHLEFEATVTDIEVPVGGHGKASVTVYFDDGQVLPFNIKDINRFTKGQKYFIKCHLAPMDDNWTIDLLEER